MQVDLGYHGTGIQNIKYEQCYHAGIQNICDPSDSFDKNAYNGSAARRNKYEKVIKAGKAKIAFINEKSRYK